MDDVARCNIILNIYRYIVEHPDVSGDVIRAVMAEAVSSSDVTSMIAVMVRDGMVTPSTQGYMAVRSQTTCYSPTALYAGGCQLLSNFDADFDGVLTFDDVMRVRQLFEYGDLTLDEYLFVVETFLFYNGAIDSRCPYGTAIFPVHPNHQRELDVVINCNEPTEHFASVCRLLDAYDVDADGIITLDDVDRADNAYVNGDLSANEFFCVAVCYLQSVYDGRIDQLCPVCLYVGDPDAQECMPDQYTCQENGLYVCDQGRWKLVTANSSLCGGDDLPFVEEPVPDEPVPDEPVPDEPVPDEPVPDVSTPTSGAGFAAVLPAVIALIGGVLYFVFKK